MTSERASSSRFSNSPYSLQRGKACSNCRKRKIKCDGLRPTCTQCTRSARPGDACEYADGGRTRTQMLEDNISRLEARIRELEEPDDENAVRLHIPYASASSSSHAALSPSSMSPRTPGSSTSASTDSSPGQSAYSVFQEEPPSDVVHQLLQTFLPHAMDFGFFLNVPRFRSAALSPLPMGHYDRPCPGLLSSVYLFGVHLSGNPNGDEGAYLSRALLQTANILSTSHPHRIVHGVQAEILLSVYFFRAGRILEGKYHMSAAVSLTLGAGLHRIRALNMSRSSSSFPLHQINVAGPLLGPPIDQIEEGERINAFWTAFTLSNCWGVAVGSLSSMVFESHGSTIDTPWPLDMADYEEDLLPQGHLSTMTVQNFLRQTPSSSAKEFSTMAMYAKSSVLLDRAANLAAMYRPDMPADEASRFGAAFSSLDHLIDSFRSTLLPLNQRNVSPFEFGTVFVTHTIAYIATIQLHGVFCSTDANSREKALTAATGCVSFLRQVDMSAVVHINPILGSCWTSLCQLFIDEIARIRHGALHSTWPPDYLGSREQELVNMLEKVFATMAVFSIDSVLIGFQLKKVQEAFQAI